MRQRIYLVGPSSTGKTTVCHALAQKLGLSGPAVVKEVAREVMVRNGFTRKDVGTIEMQLAILQAHLQQEKAGDACPIQLCDRSAVDPIVYAVLQAPSVTEGQIRFNQLVNLPDFQTALPTYRRSIFILFGPVPEWLFDDGVRLLEQQTECFELFKKILKDLNIPFREIGSEMRLLEDRVVSILHMLNSVPSSHL